MKIKTLLIVFSLLFLCTLKGYSHVESQGNLKNVRTFNHPPMKDYGLKDNISLSKILPHSENTPWKHAWSAIPAYVISRRICGIEALEPSFWKIQINPHPGDLKWSKIKHPTIRGSVEVDFKNRVDFFKMNITIPPNTRPKVYIPLNFDDYTLTQNGEAVQGEKQEKF